MKLDAREVDITLPIYHPSAMKTIQAAIRSLKDDSFVLKCDFEERPQTRNVFRAFIKDYLSSDRLTVEHGGLIFCSPCGMYVGNIELTRGKVIFSLCISDEDVDAFHF